MSNIRPIRPNSVRFFSILLAFRAFSGKPLKVTDAAEELTLSDLSTLEECLRTLAAEYRKEDPKDWPELHKLADDIEKALAG